MPWELGFLVSDWDIAFCRSCLSNRQSPRETVHSCDNSFPGTFPAFRRGRSVMPWELGFLVSDWDIAICKTHSQGGGGGVGGRISTGYRGDCTIYSL